MFELRPFPENTLPPAVQRIVTGAGPAKVMAAKGIAPLRPAELAVVIFQLSFDAEDAVRTAAEGAPATLPDRVLAGALAEPLAPEILHFFAEKVPAARGPIHEAILYNKYTADETYALLAGRLGERQLEIIVANETRFLRHPAIVEALYNNKHAPMSSVNRVIELCVRNGVKVEGIHAFEEIARSISGDPVATTPEADQAFASALTATDGVAADVADPPPLDLTGANPPPAAAPEGDQGDKKKSAIIDFSKLKLHEKIRLATLGNAYCRSVLLRDPNKVVAMAAIKSPQITEMEVVRAAGNRAVTEDVIRYIANQRDLVKLYPVKLNLVHNPKCPIALSLRFLSYLQPEDLKKLARSKNIPSALSTTARKLVQSRGIT